MVAGLLFEISTGALLTEVDFGRTDNSYASYIF